MQDFEPYGHDIANNDVCLAISLAWERNRGRQSPFYPYIRSLPEETPCFFTKENDEVRQILQELGGYITISAYAEQAYMLSSHLAEIQSGAACLLCAPVACFELAPLPPLPWYEHSGGAPQMYELHDTSSTMDEVVQSNETILMMHLCTSRNAFA